MLGSALAGGAMACAHKGRAARRCDPQAMLSANGSQGPMVRTIREIGLQESSPEVRNFLCYCDALTRRDVRATQGLTSEEGPSLLADYGAAEFKRLRRADRSPVLRLLEGVALAGIEPCDSYALEALLRIDKDRFEALAAESAPGSPAMKEKAELARRRVPRGRR